MLPQDVARRRFELYPENSANFNTVPVCFNAVLRPWANRGLIIGEVLVTIISTDEASADERHKKNLRKNMRS